MHLSCFFFPLNRAHCGFSVFSMLPEQSLMTVGSIQLENQLQIPPSPHTYKNSFLKFQNHFQIPVLTLYTLVPLSSLTVPTLVPLSSLCPDTTPSHSTHTAQLHLARNGVVLLVLHRCSSQLSQHHSCSIHIGAVLLGSSYLAGSETIPTIPYPCSSHIGILSPIGCCECSSL